MENETLVVNLFGGPGTGKSTTAALVFGQLKVDGINSELVHEFAKDLTWEERHKALKFQPYIMGKQSYHIYRLLGKVDVVITDSPILLGMIYKGDGYTEAFGQHLLELYKSWNTLNIFLERNSEIHPYVQAGRNQSEDEAAKVDQEIFTLLTENALPTVTIPVGAKYNTADAIVSVIKGSLLHQNNVS